MTGCTLILYFPDVMADCNFMLYFLTAQTGCTLILYFSECTLIIYFIIAVSNWVYFQTVLSAFTFYLFFLYLLTDCTLILLFFLSNCTFKLHFLSYLNSTQHFIFLLYFQYLSHCLYSYILYIYIVYIYIFLLFSNLKVFFKLTQQKAWIICFNNLFLFLFVQKYFRLVPSKIEFNYFFILLLILCLLFYSLFIFLLILCLFFFIDSLFTF